MLRSYQATNPGQIKAAQRVWQRHLQDETERTLEACGHFGRKVKTTYAEFESELENYTNEGENNQNNQVQEKQQAMRRRSKSSSSIVGGQLMMPKTKKSRSSNTHLI